MGCGSSATLFWGLCGQEEGEWCNLNKDYTDSDYIGREDTDEFAEWEDVYAKRMGLPEEGEEYNRHWEKRCELIRTSGCEVRDYGDHDYLIPFVAIKESIVECWQGSTEINIEHLHSSLPDMHGQFVWLKQLRAFCEVMNIKWSDPKWWLVSSYG